MAFTYSAGADTPLAKVRRRIGDTDDKRQLLQDEEVGDFLDEYGDDVYLAAAACCDAIVAKIARDYDRSNLGMSTTRSQAVTHYTDLAVKLRARADSSVVPFFGGSSESERSEIESDCDFIEPFFRREWGENR